MILFERRDSVSDRLLIDGFIRCDSYYPVCINELICDFYPNGIETEQNEYDLGSVMFDKEENSVVKQACLLKWKNKMSEQTNGAIF